MNAKAWMMWALARNELELVDEIKDFSDETEGKLERDMEDYKNAQNGYLLA